MPIFLTHKEWVESIRNKARAIGDCGYKPGIAFSISEIDKELEIVTVVFQKLKQDMTMKSNSTTEKIYIGDFEYIGGDVEGYRDGK